MSKYTTEVRFICESASGLSESKGYSDVEQIISTARSTIFDFNYPIFDENYRSILETKILKHYYTREIGEETVGLWKLRLNTRMNEIMPYYNKLYESELIEFDPMSNFNFNRESTRNIEGGGENTSESGTTSETTNWDKYNDTPQGSVGNLDSDSYLTNARKITNSNEDATENSATNTYANTDEYVEHLTGYSGVSPSKMLKEYRDILLNIDVMIIEELKDLFIQLW